MCLDEVVVSQDQDNTITLGALKLFLRSSKQRARQISHGCAEGKASERRRSRCEKTCLQFPITFSSCFLRPKPSNHLYGRKIKQIMKFHKRQVENARGIHKRERERRPRKRENVSWISPTHNHKSFHFTRWTLFALLSWSRYFKTVPIELFATKILESFSSLSRHRHISSTFFHVIDIVSMWRKCGPRSFFGCVVEVSVRFKEEKRDSNTAHECCCCAARYTLSDISKVKEGLFCAWTQRRRRSVD